jgi:hypothetical protein
MPPRVQSKGMPGRNLGARGFEYIGFLNGCQRFLLSAALNKRADNTHTHRAALALVVSCIQNLFSAFLNKRRVLLLWKARVCAQKGCLLCKQTKLVDWQRSRIVGLFSDELLTLPSSPGYAIFDTNKRLPFRSCLFILLYFFVLAFGNTLSVNIVGVGGIFA